MSFGAPKYEIPDDLQWEAGKAVVTTADFRPCIVDGMKATFHRWADKSWIVPPSPMVGGHQGGVVRGTYAIIEMKDGTVREVEPEKIQFITTSELFQRHCMGKFKVDEKQELHQRKAVENDRPLVWCVEKVHSKCGVEYLSTCPSCQNTVRGPIPSRHCPSCRAEFYGYFHSDTPWALRRFGEEKSNE